MCLFPSFGRGLLKGTDGKDVYSPAYRSKEKTTRKGIFTLMFEDFLPVGVLRARRLRGTANHDFTAMAGVLSQPSCGVEVLEAPNARWFYLFNIL